MGVYASPEPIYGSGTSYGYVNSSGVSYRAPDTAYYFTNGTANRGSMLSYLLFEGVVSGMPQPQFTASADVYGADALNPQEVPYGYPNGFELCSGTAYWPEFYPEGRFNQVTSYDSGCIIYAPIHPLNRYYREGPTAQAHLKIINPPYNSYDPSERSAVIQTGGHGEDTGYVTAHYFYHTGKKITLDSATNTRTTEWSGLGSIREPYTSFGFVRGAHVKLNGGPNRFSAGYYVPFLSASKSGRTGSVAVNYFSATYGSGNNFSAEVSVADGVYTAIPDVSSYWISGSGYRNPSVTSVTLGVDAASSTSLTISSFPSEVSADNCHISASNYSFKFTASGENPAGILNVIPWVSYRANDSSAYMVLDNVVVTGVGR